MRAVVAGAPDALPPAQPWVSKAEGIAVKGLWSRWRRIGIPDDMPPIEARHHELANIAALIGASFAVPFAVFAQQSGNRVGLIALTGFAVALLTGPVVRGFGRLWVATTLLLLAAMGYFGVVAPWVFGTSSGAHHFLLVVLIGAYLVFPPRWYWTAHVLTGATLVIYLAILFGPETAGVAPLGEEPLVAANLAGVAAMMLLFGMYNGHVVAKSDEIVAAEQARSERLLLNVLPSQIAERLKGDENPIADRHEDVTVLFADIVGFTPLSAKLDPNSLVSRLNAVFTRFDEIADEHGLEKIKTIGDAYMVAGGVPIPTPDHAEAVARMAFDMLEAVETFDGVDGVPLRVRIGIHTGPLVAGVIGSHKFAYDLWGDTVNTASRLESHGAPGRIHVSSAVADRLGDDFDLEKQAPIDIKGKGKMETYWLRPPSTRSSTRRGAATPSSSFSD